MNCKEYRELIEDELDISLHGDPEKRVRLHLEHCDACRAYFERRRAEHIALFTGINAVYSGLHLPDGFANRLVDSVRTRKVGRRVWRHFRLPKWALIAASIVAMAGFLFAAKVMVEGLRGAEAAKQDADVRGDAPNALEVTDATEVTGPAAASLADALVVSSVPGVLSVSSASKTKDQPPTTSDQLETNQGEVSMNKSRIASAALTAALMAGVAPMSSGAVTTNLIDSVEITADTNITVAANEVLKIEYVYGDNPVTVTKSGEGRLEIATSSLTNLSVVVADGTFASARPQTLQINEDFRPTLRIDANDTSKFTTSQSNGTNFISKITDADGGSRWLASWGGTYNKPFVATEKLNGLGLIDFGAFLDRNVVALSGGHGGNLAVNKIDGKDGFPLREYFYVWKDRDDLYDPRLAGEPDYYGASVLGNNGNYFLRCKGNATQGFGLITGGSYNTFKMNLILDGKKVSNTYCPSRGFHVLRNRAYDDNIPYLTMIGWNNPRGGGFYLAELIACSNALSEAVALRVEAQLQSKWLGMKLNRVAVHEGAALDVGAFPFKIGTLDVQDGVTVAGITNLCFDTLARASSNVVATGEVKIDGCRQPLMPDFAFDGVAAIDVVGTSRVQTVSSTAGILVKTGAGELRLVDPAMSNITVSAGALSISPLDVRSSDYHLDANAAGTISWAESDGKKLVSQWRDMEDPSRMFYSVTWRKYSWDESTSLRKPYLAENAVGSLAMLDFGTFATVNHPDGYGAALEANPSLALSAGAHDTFVVWSDYPEVKNYAPVAGTTSFTGPCFFGHQYHWTRGLGGNGEGFPVHATDTPPTMYAAGNVIVDGKTVNGYSTRLGDGVHVLMQRADMADGNPGAPVYQLGGSSLFNVTDSTGARKKGIYGGLKIGEVLLFKEYLTDRLRMRISGALCSKWRGDTNKWAYASLSVAAGATLNHPYADLAPEALDLAGTISAVSVKPRTLRVAGSVATVAGTLELGEGAKLVIGGDYENGLAAISADAVNVTGRGTLEFSGEVSPRFIKSAHRVVASGNVAMTSIPWKAPALAANGMRAVLRAKADGLYVEFSSCGMAVSFR